MGARFLPPPSVNPPPFPPSLTVLLIVLAAAPPSPSHPPFMSSLLHRAPWHVHAKIHSIYTKGQHFLFSLCMNFLNQNPPKSRVWWKILANLLPWSTPPSPSSFLVHCSSFFCTSSFHGPCRLAAILGQGRVPRSSQEIYLERYNSGPFKSYFPMSIKTALLWKSSADYPYFI